MVRIVFNRFSAIGQKTGIGHYSAQLLTALGEIPGLKVFPFPTGLTWEMGQFWGTARHVLSRFEKRKDSSQAATANIRAKLKKFSLQSVRSLGQKLLIKLFQKFIRGKTFQLYHEPNVIPLECDVTTLATVHDLSPLTHPEWHPAGRVSFFEKKLQASLKQTQHFIAVSEFTRQEMIRILGIPGSKIFRVHNGIHPHFRKWPVEKFSAELRRLKLPNRYLLHVGTIEPRKNLLMLLKAYGALPRNLREACPLVLVGGWGWNSSDVANYFLSTARHQGVISIGYANDQELTAIYNGARALVFPTLYEGFGFPPLEMKACGGAVLASSAAALVEILGSGAHFIDPGDTEGWTKAMAQIIQDDDWHQDLRLTGSNLASKYSWTQSAHHTLAVYQKLIGEPAHARQAA